jgi:membrane-bound serine protease (ClpP class)
MVGTFVLLTNSTSAALQESVQDLAPVHVLQVTGLVDGIVVNEIERAMDRAQAADAQALVLQMDVEGTVADSDQVQALLQRVADTDLAIAVWVGPARSSRAYGQAAQLLAVADVTAMVRGSRIGYVGEPLTVDGAAVSFGASTSQLIVGSLDFDAARRAGALKLFTTDEGVPSIRNMVASMDGVEVDGVVLDTAVPSAEGSGSQFDATTPVFFKLGLVDRLLHTVVDPSMAYLLFVVGLALLIFEFFTAGVGVAATVGVICTVLGCFGLGELPTRPLGVVLLVAAMAAFAIDVQVGVPRVWTGIGLVLFVAGSWFLYRPIPGNDVRVGWITLAVGIIGIALTFINGMPSMVRTRFATPTIGREWMIGSSGTATTSIQPDGVALVAGARWRARTNRATPIKAGDELRVIGIDGVTLEVEPEQGAARDYRERRSAGSSPGNT